MVTYNRGVIDDDRVFKALADRTRRFLLDLLFARDGRTLTELESELEMTRFGVMKHLRVLEDAGLDHHAVVGAGEAALPERGAHSADPQPVDRQVHRAPGLGARGPQVRTGGTGMAQDQGTKTSVTTQMHEIYIRATPQAIWDAITTPEWTAKYGYGGLVEYDLRPGGAFSGARHARHDGDGHARSRGRRRSRGERSAAGSWCRRIGSCSTTR